MRVILPPCGRRRLGDNLLALGAVISFAGMAGVSGIGSCLDQDAHLVSLCNRYVEADLRHEVLCDRQSAMAKPLTPEGDAEWSRLDDLAVIEGGIIGELELQIAALSATSPAWVQAKAKAVERMSRFYKDSDSAALLRSLISDLLPAGRA